MESLVFALSPIKLIVCNGGAARGISFSQASVLVDFLLHLDRKGRPLMNVYPFTDIFKKGNDLLTDYIKFGKKSSGVNQQILEVLLLFLSNIEEASKGLQEEKQESERNKSETDWAARLAVHFFSPLSQTKNYVLDNHGLKKCERCPCSCQRIIRYGDTSIGNPKTWYGRFDILIGKFAPQETCSRSKKPRCEIDVGATVVPVPENPDTDTLDDESSSDDGLSQIEVKTDDLNNHLSQLFSQTIVFSFYQKKCNPASNIVPSIGVSKNHIQFHFYDSEKDIYLASKQMPLFYENKTLQIPTVIATWLVLNYKHLSSGVTKNIESEGKFGFHSQIFPESLHLYQNNLEMGLTVKPETFFLTADCYATLVLRKDDKMD